jgi:hypothetical protein
MRIHQQPEATGVDEPQRAEVDDDAMALLLERPQGRLEICLASEVELAGEPDDHALVIGLGVQLEMLRNGNTGHRPSWCSEKWSGPSRLS